MKIAVICPPMIKTPPDNYGGMERIVHWVGRGLVKRGHEVTIFGRTGSWCDGARIITHEGGEGIEYAEIVATHADEFDIIHDITHDKLLMQLRPDLSSKTINTLQAMAKRGPNTTCISYAQRSALGYSDSVPVIYNLVPTSEFIPLDNPFSDYILYMGSINDYKGVDIAVEVCAQAGERLYIAGVAWDQDYHKKFIEPHIDGEKVVWHGDVGGDQKLWLLQNAKALIHPVRWTEAGAIVVSEALSCGVPVLGSDNGVLPELVTPAVGFISEVMHFDHGYPHMTGGCYNKDQWSYAISNLDKIDRFNCRLHAEVNLDENIMIEDYIKQYERLLSEGPWE